MMKTEISKKKKKAKTQLSCTNKIFSMMKTEISKKKKKKKTKKKPKHLCTGVS